ncbi:MAG: threonine--tRNA ligase [Candidatus Thalassarchaeaceae archaeon]|jgi:threonyl-tRNA synthetase|nr:threonine--tRNA ligase [Candidatus Thalassarchaeaceae archaeon]
MIQIHISDSEMHEYSLGTSAGDVIRNVHGKKCGAVAALVDGVERDMSHELSDGQRIEPIIGDSEAGLYIIRHSTAHLLAQAVLEYYPNAKPTIGPPIENGFYYDFHMDPISDDELKKIEKRMKEISRENIPIVREEYDNAALREIFSENPFKIEIMDDKIEDGNGSSVYRQGDFVDLCRGPHVPTTAMLRWFKLTSTSTCYWKADASKESLVRIYGWSFASKDELQNHETLMREAAKRDHRKLGKDLQLFHIDEMVGQGLILWTPRGSIVRNQLQDFISNHLGRQGYHQVYTPHIGKLDLYRTSGHYPYYQESQYPPLVERDLMTKLADEGCSCGELSNRMDEGEIDGYLLKPMNCPHHIRIFTSQARSYRDLPLRLAEFGTVYRWEQSGEISGMTRVRGFTQDDAHLFVTEDQIAQEVLGCIELVQIIFGNLGMEDYRIRVGLRDPDSSKYVGEPEKWDKAEQACRDAAASLGVPFTEEEGEAAFYGPKIDFVVRDVIGREWQLGTVQVDYNLPERFDLSYTGADGEKHRPVMIHRAPFGSMERFCGVLIEHFAGKFPTWLSPTQVHILTISEKHKQYANEVACTLKNAGFRIELDDSDNTIGKKIRTHRAMQPSYMLILGDEESENQTVSIRNRSGEQSKGISIDEFVADLELEITSRSAHQSLVKGE